MLQFSVLGNLGADARVEDYQGRKFVSFSVGHNEIWNDVDGTRHERTMWVSCALNGDGGGLLPYLKKGRSVFVQGRGSCRVYSSPKERKFVAGLNISVDRVELVGGMPDAVPSYLYDDNGVEHKVVKAFYVPNEEIKSLWVQGQESVALRSRDGSLFYASRSGLVSAVPKVAELQQENTEDAPPF